MIGLAGLRPGYKVLDVGCGTGVLTLLAAREVGAQGRVIGFDLSDGMLAKANTLARAGQFAERIEFVKGDAERMQFADAGFQSVVSLYALRHFPDPAQALRLGGLVVVVVDAARLTEADQLFKSDAELRRIVAKVFPHQLERKRVVPRGHRGVRGENIARRHDLERRVKIKLVLSHAAPDQFERKKRAVAFIHVIRRGLDPHRVQRVDAADAEHDLLLDPHLMIAAIELRGDEPVVRAVLRHVRVAGHMITTTALTKSYKQAAMQAFVPGEDYSSFGIVHSRGLERYQNDSITVLVHLGSGGAHSAVRTTGS